MSLSGMQWAYRTGTPVWKRQLTERSGDCQEAPIPPPGHAKGSASPLVSPLVSPPNAAARVQSSDRSARSPPRAETTPWLNLLDLPEGCCPACSRNTTIAEIREIAPLFAPDDQIGCIREDSPLGNSIDGLSRVQRSTSSSDVRSIAAAVEKENQHWRVAVATSGYPSASSKYVPTAAPKFQLGLRHFSHQLHTSLQRYNFQAQDTQRLGQFGPALDVENLAINHWTTSTPYRVTPIICGDRSGGEVVQKKLGFHFLTLTGALGFGDVTENRNADGIWLQADKDHVESAAHASVYLPAEAPDLRNREALGRTLAESTGVPTALSEMQKWQEYYRTVLWNCAIAAMAPPTGPTQQTSGTEFILVRMEYICGSDAPIHHRFKVKSVEPHLRPYEEKLQALKTIGDIEMGPAFYGLAGYILSVRWATEYEHIECRSFAVDRTSAFATKNPSWRDLFRIHVALGRPIRWHCTNKVRKEENCQCGDWVHGAEVRLHSSLHSSIGNDGS
ncbi:hypothetical protein C8R47DRAFT_1084981 [Mycena vitilis]|nr:hypothetical protein C8R47DRAFT_1084981 [Mycena vitilis]